MLGFVTAVAATAVVGGEIGFWVYKKYSERQARFDGYSAYEDGFLVRMKDGDEFWTSRRYLETLQTLRDGEYVQYRVSPVRNHGFKIGWL
jgi:hypothetical protein